MEPNLRVFNYFLKLGIRSFRIGYLFDILNRVSSSLWTASNFVLQINHCSW